ncbi:MAG: hypothetical protein CMH54_11615 [Myxococcales bacterium]|nr:hypothetical protein [Myxococcales bacterium]
MAEPGRYCPLCEEWMDDDVCPKDGVPTVDRAKMEPEAGGLANGTMIAQRFRIESLLGQGGMGAVYLATQTSMNRKVALKTLLKTLLRESKLVKRFYREAQSASALDHPNIVRIYDFGIDKETDIPYIAMEYLEGLALDELLQAEGPLPERRVTTILLGVARALTEAHDKDIVHRDLKPENIHVRELSDGQEHVKVLDFGIAKVLRSDSDSYQSLTGTGVTVGTPMYMSPEQTMGQPLDFRSDLYSLGCVMFELLSGGPPYMSDEPIGILMKHLREEAPALPAKLSDGQPPSEGLVALYTSLMAKKRLDRPCSTKAVVDILSALSRAAPVDVKKTLASARTAAISTGQLADKKPRAVEDILSDLVKSPEVRSEPLTASDVRDALQTDEEPLVAAANSGFGRSKATWAVVLVVLGVIGAVFAFMPTGKKNKDATNNRQDVSTSDTGIASIPDTQSDITSSTDAEPERQPPAKEKVATQVRTIQIESDPPGAEVWDGATQLGKTPLGISMADDAEPMKLRLKRKGYKTKNLTVMPTSDDIVQVKLRQTTRRRKASTPVKPKPKRKDKKTVDQW